MAKKSRSAGAPDWVREQAKIAAEVIRPGAALTAAAAAGAGVILEGVSDALVARTKKGGRLQPTKGGRTAPHKIDKPKRKKATDKKKATARKAAASKKKRAAKRSRAPQKAVKKRRAARSS